jgi:hypothetical protein
MQYTKINWQPTACLHCGKEYLPRKGYQKFCSHRCRNNAQTNLSRFNRDLSTCTVGAIGELQVAVDLLSRGFNVFRALSPACPCDLAILMDDKLIRVEVTTGYVSHNGRLAHPPKDKSKFDILAICTGEGIVYKPDLIEQRTPTNGQRATLANVAR